MEWVRTTFEACVQAQRHVDEQQLGYSKVALCLADIGHHEEQSVLLFWLAAFSSGFDLSDECVRDHAFVTSGGIPETKRQVEDLFRHLRKEERNQKNGRIMSTWRALLRCATSPTMRIPERNYISSTRKVRHYTRGEDEGEDAGHKSNQLKASDLIGMKKAVVPEELQQSCLEAIRLKKVIPAGSDSARRTVAATFALVETAAMQFQPLLHCWLGTLAHSGTYWFNRREKVAYISLGTYTWASGLWELEFLGFTPTDWYWVPAKPSANVPCFRTIASEETWCGLRLQPMPTCVLPETVRSHAWVLGGKKADFVPLIQYALSAIDLAQVTSETWKILCGHVGGQAQKNAKGNRDKNSWAEGTLRAMGYDCQGLEAQLQRLAGGGEDIDPDENEEILDALESLGDEGKHDFPDLWRATRQRKSEQIAEKEIQKYLKSQGKDGKSNDGENADAAAAGKAGKGVGEAGMCEKDVTVPSAVPVLQPPAKKQRLDDAAAEVGADEPVAPTPDAAPALKRLLLVALRQERLVQAFWGLLCRHALEMRWTRRASPRQERERRRGTLAYRTT